MTKISSQLALREGSLGNYGNKVATFSESPAQSVFDFSGRSGLLRLREGLWDLSSVPDLRKCGRVARSPRLEVVQGAHGVNLRGLVRCHSVWSCPMCSAVIRSERAAQLAASVRSHLVTGGADFLTLTVPHSLADTLPKVYSLVASAWTALLRDRSLRQFRSKHGWLGFVRTVEVTYSRRGFGFHPHVHALDFWSEPLPLDVLAEYRRLLLRVWQRAVLRLGGGLPSVSNGIHLVPVLDETPDKIAEYLLASGVAHELTSLSTKTGSGSGLTPFEILGQAIVGDRGRWLPVWHAYEHGTRGRRMLGATSGLLRSLQVEEENGEVSEDALGVVLGSVSAVDWRRLSVERSGGVRGVQSLVEAAAVAGGQSAVDLVMARLLGLAVVE